MGAEINPITQACLDISEFLKTKWMYIILIVVSVIAAITAASLHSATNNFKFQHRDDTDE